MRWSRLTYHRLLRECQDVHSSHDKGRTLENFLAYTFTRFRGVTLQGQDLRSPSQELDLVLYNDKQEQYFASASAEIIVEAKNWRTPVGSPEVSWFLEKMRQRGITHGFLVAAEGVTGDCRERKDGAIDSLYMALQYQMRPVVLTFDELALVNSREDLIELFKSKCCKLLLKQVI